MADRVRATVRVDGVVDGAPATRFLQRLSERIEVCHGLDTASIE